MRKKSFRRKNINTSNFVTLESLSWTQTCKHGHNNEVRLLATLVRALGAYRLLQIQLTNRPNSNKKDAPTNPRGIPYAPFVDNVADYCTSRAEVEPTLKSFSEMISKYQFMEVNTSRRAAGLKDKIPDIQKTLETVRFLKGRKEGDAELESFFELNDTLYAKAKVPKTDEVYLWLGANVMLSYPMDEAVELLEGKLEAAKSGLEHAEEDMDFLREQITVSRAPKKLKKRWRKRQRLTVYLQTLEVATARVYNWDVGQRRKEKAEGKGEEPSD